MNLMTLEQRVGLLRAANKAGDRIAASMWDMVMAFHKPFDVAGDGTGPAICPQCKTDWPCETSTNAYEQREALRATRAD